MGCGGEEDCCDLSLVGHGKQDGERLKVSRKHLCVAKQDFFGRFFFSAFLEFIFVGGEESFSFQTENENFKQF